MKRQHRTRAFVQAAAFLAALLCAPAAPARAAAGACGDDLRLSRLGELLQGGQAIEAPFTVLPDTFLRLHPAARKALGNALVVCPGIPLNAQGRPMRPVILPFADIWEIMEMAVNAGDWEEVAFLRESFRPQPLPAEALFSLLEVPMWDEKNMKKLATALGIQPGVNGRRFFALDVFHALGGRAEAPARVGWAITEKNLSAARAKAEALKRQAIFVPYSGKYAEEAEQSLARCGVTAVHVDKFFKTPS
ncbi:MAG: hypothetical protein HDQ89_00070 [Desulfovibrio sp.]|nr:hypothetical protein [Desulfovibrio sp.]